MSTIQIGLAKLLTQDEDIEMEKFYIAEENEAAEHHLPYRTKPKHFNS